MIGSNDIANLSSIVKDYHSITIDLGRWLDILWLNVTIHSQSEIYIADRWSSVYYS